MEKIDKFKVVAALVRSFFSAFPAGITDCLIKDPAEKFRPRSVKKAMLNHYEAVGDAFNDIIFYPLARINYSIEEIEDRLRKATAAEKTGRNEEQDLPEDYFKVLEIVGKYFTNSISLKRTSGGKGTMTIHFSSDEEIHKFLNALEKSSI